MASREPGAAKGPAHVAWVAGPQGRPAGGGPDPDAEDQAVRDLVEAALELGVGWLSLQEPSGGRVLRRLPDSFAARGVEVVDGDSLDPLSGHGGDRVVLHVVVVAARSGRSGFLDALRRLADARVPAERVDDAALSEALTVPDVDLVVVSGGDRRVPDLLLWQVAYGEIVFLPEPWPRAGRAELAAAVGEYRRRDRRYGGLVASA